jgi:hypothetical protein
MNTDFLNDYYPVFAFTGLGVILLAVLLFVVGRVRSSYAHWPAPVLGVGLLGGILLILTPVMDSVTDALIAAQPGSAVPAPVPDPVPWAPMDWSTVLIVLTLASVLPAAVAGAVWLVLVKVLPKAGAARKVATREATAQTVANEAWDEFMADIAPHRHNLDMLTAEGGNHPDAVAFTEMVKTGSVLRRKTGRVGPDLGLLLKRAKSLYRRLLAADLRFMELDDIPATVSDSAGLWPVLDGTRQG